MRIIFQSHLPPDVFWTADQWMDSQLLLHRRWYRHKLKSRQSKYVQASIKMNSGHLSVLLQSSRNCKVPARSSSGKSRHHPTGTGPRGTSAVGTKMGVGELFSNRRKSSWKADTTFILASQSSTGYMNTVSQATKQTMIWK